MLAAAKDEARRLQAEASAKLTETIARRAALATGARSVGRQAAGLPLRPPPVTCRDVRRRTA